MKLLIDFLLVSGIVVNTIIIVVFFKIKNRDIHQNILVTIFIILFFYLVSGYGIFHKIIWIQYLAITLEGIFFLIGPLIYLYIISLRQYRVNALIKKWKHFIPFVLYFLIITTPVLISAYKKRYIFQYLITLNEHSYLKSLIELIFILIYAILALKLLNKFNNRIKEHYSQLDYKNIRWIKLLTLGVLIVSAINVLTSSIESLLDNSYLLDLIFIISFVSFIFYLGYFGFQQEKIELSEDKNKRTALSIRSYASEGELLLFHKLVKTKFSKSKPFLDEDLTLSKLADFFDTTDKKLSYFLNNHLKTSFYDFINKHRVQEFKSRLEQNSNSNFSLLGIAYDCGFKSKSSFNRVFKKETGMSPSEFRKTLINRS